MTNPDKKTLREQVEKILRINLPMTLIQEANGHEAINQILKAVETMVIKIVGEEEKVIIDEDLPDNVNDDINEGGLTRNNLKREILSKLKKEIYD